MGKKLAITTLIAITGIFWFKKTYMTLQETAIYLGRDTEEDVLWFINNGHYPAIKIMGKYYINKNDLDAILNPPKDSSVY